MNEDRVENVPYIVHEGSMARMERMIKRMTYALVMAIVLLFASNALWLYEWMQYDYVSETITLESTKGHANYIGNDGDIYNGESDSAADIAPEEEIEGNP